MIRRSLSKARHGGDEGAVAIIVVFFILIALILCAFVVDRGMSYMVKAQLQTAVDAAALAGAQELCTGSSAQPAAVATAYGKANGLDDATMIVGTPIRSGQVMYLNVRASRTLDQVFGGFVGVPRIAVGAQATVSRLCLVEYRFVANKQTEFTGNSADLTETPIFAGECFRSTGNTNKFGVIAVSTPANDPTNICGGRDPIDVGNSTIQTRVYGVTGADRLTATLAASRHMIGTESVTDIVARVTTPPPAGTGPLDCRNDALANADVFCAGKFSMKSPFTTHTVVAEGAIDLANGVKFSNPVISSISEKVTLNNSTELGAGSVIYAPAGVVFTSGTGKVDLSAFIFGDEIKFAGSGVSAPGGAEAYGPGPVSMLQ